MKIRKSNISTSYSVGGVNGQPFRVLLQVFKKHGGFRLTFDFNTELLIKIFGCNSKVFDFTRGINMSFNKAMISGYVIAVCKKLLDKQCFKLFFNKYVDDGMLKYYKRFVFEIDMSGIDSLINEIQHEYDITGDITIFER